MDDLRDLQLDVLVEPWVMLRPVNRNTVEYLELRDSIDNRGFLNSIAVRPCSRRPGVFEIIDGMYRFACAKDLELETIPVIVKHGVSDNDVLALQLQANAVRPKIRPCDFAKQIHRLQEANPGVTLNELSVLLTKSRRWISLQLDLLRLANHEQKMVDRGEICLANGYMLSRIPSRMRREYIDQAKTMKVKPFEALAVSVIKQYKEAVKTGKLEAFYTEDFQPQCYLRTFKEIVAEAEVQQEGPLVLATEDCKTPLDGWNSALQWVMHFDRQSVEIQEKEARERHRDKWDP